MDYILLSFIVVILYILIIFIIKYFGIGSKEKNSNSNNCCPDCKNNLKRERRIFRDKITNYLSLGLMDWRRYICEKCGWEGIKWNKQHKSRRN